MADVTGVRDDLMKAFGSNVEMVNDILTMTYFSFIDKLSYSHLAQWQRKVKAPSERKLTSTIVDQKKLIVYICNAKVLINNGP